MGRSALIQYVSAWLDEYPGRKAEAAELARFRGMMSVSQSDAKFLVRWKFQRDARRRNAAMVGTEHDRWEHSERRIAEALEVARSCPGVDLPPLAIVANSQCGVKGWGPAMASALLAVCMPERFTLGDGRALASARTLVELGWVRADPVLPPGDTFRFDHWEPYLAVCRRVAARCSRPLRDVDQALWAANGRTSLPTTPVASGAQNIPNQG